MIHKFYFLVFMLVSCSSFEISKKEEIPDFKKYQKVLSENPARYLESNIEKGDYRYWGFRQRKTESKMRWIPGIEGPREDIERFDFVSLGLELNDVTDGAAERFFRSYNILLKERRAEALRSGKKFDVYWNEL